MYIVKIDGEEILITQDDLDTLNSSEHQSKIHVLENKRAYKIENIQTGSNPKTGQLTVDHKVFSYQILDKYDQLVASMGLDELASSKVTDIIAPMPGLILDIMVKSGDSVEEGASILILEAMKMENVIKAEGEGIVKSVNMNIGDTVDKGQIIIEME